MKIIAITASPRGAQSQTASLTAELIQAAAGRGAETVTFDLCQLQVAPCNACEDCHRGPGCSIKDDAGRIIRPMAEADGIVLASPVYLDHVSAQLKALLDRTSHYIHCLSLMGKYFAAVTTSGGGSGDTTAAFIRSYAISVGAQYVGAVHKALPLNDTARQEARALGESLVEAISEKRAWSDQIAAIESHKAHFRGGIIHNRERWSYEYGIWQQKGWL